jgi:hypothetical protein
MDWVQIEQLAPLHLLGEAAGPHKVERVMQAFFVNAPHGSDEPIPPSQTPGDR